MQIASRAYSECSPESKSRAERSRKPTCSRSSGISSLCGRRRRSSFVIASRIYLEKCCDRLGGVAVHPLDHMRIPVERDRDRRVAQSFLYDLRMHARRESQRRPRVPGCIMRGECGHPSILGESLRGPGETVDRESMDEGLTLADALDLLDDYNAETDRIAGL